MAYTFIGQIAGIGTPNSITPDMDASVLELIFQGQNGILGCAHKISLENISDIIGSTVVMGSGYALCYGYKGRLGSDVSLDLTPFAPSSEGAINYVTLFLEFNTLESPNVFKVGTRFGQRYNLTWQQDILSLSPGIYQMPLYEMKLYMVGGVHYVGIEEDYTAALLIDRVSYAKSSYAVTNEISSIARGHTPAIEDTDLLKIATLGYVKAAINFGVSSVSLFGGTFTMSIRRAANYVIGNIFASLGSGYNQSVPLIPVLAVGALIGTLPEGYRPNSNIVIPFYLYGFNDADESETTAGVATAYSSDGSIKITILHYTSYVVRVLDICLSIGFSVAS